LSGFRHTLGCARDQVFGHFALSLGFDAIMSRHVESWLTVDSRCQVLSCATAEEGAFFHCGCCNRVLGKAAEVVKSEVDAEPRESARKRVPTIIGARERPTTDAVRGLRTIASGCAFTSAFVCIESSIQHSSCSHCASCGRGDKFKYSSFPKADFDRGGTGSCVVVERAAKYDERLSKREH